MAPKESNSAPNVAEPAQAPPVVEVVVGPSVPRRLVFGARPQVVCTNGHWFPQEQVDECEGCEHLQGGQLVQITQEELELLQMLESLPEDIRASILARVDARAAALRRGM